MRCKSGTHERLTLPQRYFLARHHLRVHYTERLQWWLLGLIPRRFVYLVTMEGTIRVIRDDEIVSSLLATDVCERLQRQRQ